MLLWPLGWFLTGTGLMLGDVYGEPSRGPLWLPLLLGGLGWGGAGGLAEPGDGTARVPRGLAWAAIFAATLLGGMRWAGLVEDGGGAGFEGLVAAFGLGGAAGGLLTGMSAPAGSRRPGRVARGFSAAATYGVLFLIGAYLGTLASYLVADAVEGILGGLVGETAALALGFGLGWALGGLAAGAAAVIARAPARRAAS